MLIGQDVYVGNRNYFRYFRKVFNTYISGRAGGIEVKGL